MSKEEYYKSSTLMKNKGNYEHNMKVIQEGKGFFVVARSPNPEDSQRLDHTVYEACPYCYSFYSFVNIASHIRKCNFKPANEIVYRIA